MIEILIVVLHCRDAVHYIRGHILEIYLLQFLPLLRNLAVKVPQLVPEGVAEVIQQLLMPSIVLVVNFRLNHPVVDDDRAEMLLSLRIIECLPSVFDVREHLLPNLYVVRKLLLNLFRINFPQRLVIQPSLNIFLHLLKCQIESEKNWVKIKKYFA